MSYRQTTDQRLDVTIGVRIFNSAWFVTCIGIAIIQMQLLAQAWQESHLAVWTACVASFWMLGSVLITRLDTRQQRAARLWGVTFIVCAFLWVQFLLAPKFHTPNLLSSLLPFDTFIMTLIRGGELAVIAFLLGVSSTAWLVQKRPWPAVNERISLAKALISTMVGLCVVWLFPAAAGTAGLVCLSPLLVLDFWPQACAPLPAPGKRIANWYDTSEGADRWQLQLHKHNLPSGWWWSYLAKRGRLSLVLLASSIAVILGGIWSAVPTPFASNLSESHTAPILGWLVLSQLFALAIGACCFRTLRGVLGAPDRLIPQKWQVYAWFAAIGSVLLMPSCLLMLGLPSLQAPWALAASIAIYTLAGAIWGMLLPRLKPSLSTVIFAQRHLMLRQVNAQLNKGQLAFERAQEEYANRLLLTTEGLLTALIAPLLGWLLDQWSVDGVLMASGIFLCAFLGIALAVIGLLRVIQSRKSPPKATPVGVRLPRNATLQRSSRFYLRSAGSKGSIAFQE
ncbi:MAG: hypothetical protein NVSMB27_25710 [Ktedonobacteraceae bacterium]